MFMFKGDRLNKVLFQIVTWQTCKDLWALFVSNFIYDENHFQTLHFEASFY